MILNVVYPEISRNPLVACSTNTPQNIDRNCCDLDCSLNLCDDVKCGEDHNFTDCDILCDSFNSDNNNSEDVDMIQIVNGSLEDDGAAGDPLINKLRKSRKRKS